MILIKCVNMFQYHTCAFQYPLCPDFCRPDVCVNSTWLVCPDMGMFGLVRAMLGWISVGRSLAHGGSTVRIVGHLGDLGWILWYPVSPPWFPAPCTSWGSGSEVPGCPPCYPTLVQSYFSSFLLPCTESPPSSHQEDGLTRSRNQG